MASQIVTDMTATLRDVLGGLTDPLRKQQLAKDEAKLHGVTINGVRWNAAQAISKLSLDGQWSMTDLDIAAKAAVESLSANNKATAKALEVFASQLKAVAKPRVRVIFPVLSDAIEKAWAMEDEEIAMAAAAGEPADAPVRKFVTRKFELLLRACREIQEGKTGLTITCAADVKQWAIDNDPDFDAVRIRKRIGAIVETIDAMHVDFGLNDLELARKYLASITADSLIAARKELTRERAVSTQEHKALKEAPAAAKAGQPSQNTERPLAPIPPVIAERITQASVEASVDEDESTLEGAFDPASMDVAASSDFVDDAINNRVQLAA